MSYLPPYSPIVVVTPTLQKQLRKQIEQDFQNDIHRVIEQWNIARDMYGNPPKPQAINEIIHAQKTINCDYLLINGICQLLLGLPYRNHSPQSIPLLLKQQVITTFNEKFRQKNGISWQNFDKTWGNQFNDSQPPRRQTLEKFFNTDDRNTCKHWIIDGLCQLLLDCTFDRWIEQNSKKNPQIAPINPSNLDSGEIRWIGRESIVKNLKNKLIDITQDYRLISIVGLTGIGKTSLSARLMVETDIQNIYPLQKVVSFDCEEPSFDLITKTLLGEQAVFSSSPQSPNPSSQSNQLLSQPNNIVDAVVAFLRSRSCLLILDMVEEILMGNQQGTHSFKDPRFQTFFEQILKTETLSSRIIVTCQDKLPSLLDGRYLNRHHPEVLKGLDRTESLELFQQWDIKPQTTEDQDYLERIITIYEGHPLALRVIAGEIRASPYHGEVKAYWADYGEELEQVEQLKHDPDIQSKSDRPRLDRYSNDLRNLVKTRIDRTFHRLLGTDRLACLLLCMGAIYRRPVERKAWLAMISEYDIEAQSIAFDNLKLRFLLESEKSNGQTLYRLHSLIRRIALDHLSELEDNE